MVARPRSTVRITLQVRVADCLADGRLLALWSDAMGRFEPTGKVEVPGLEHSVADLPWGVLRGALGPSDGTAGALSNVPSPSNA